MQSIATNKSPSAIGPYSQAIKTGELLFVSGQLPIVLDRGAFPDGGIKEQTEQVLQNLKAVLEAGGSSLDKVVKTTVFLSDMALFAEMNEVYAQYFSEPFPARACFSVKELPKKALVEIEAVAEL